MLKKFYDICKYINVERGLVMLMGEKIKKVRLQRGWTQRELALRAHVRLATLCEIETGVRTETRTDIARRLARVLGVSVDYLVGMYEEDDQGDVEPADVAMVGAYRLSTRAHVSP